MKPVTILVILSLLSGCAEKQPASPDQSKSAANSTQAFEPVERKPDTKILTLEDWTGVYSSPKEIGGFTGTVLVLEKDLGGDGLSYRMSFHSDVVMANAIPQDLLRGSCLTEEDRVYIPQASGYYFQDEPQLTASVDKYTRVAINGHVTLMRDDAYDVFQAENRLYDYGILIKVVEEVDALFDFENVEHKSIKVLYDDPTKEWRDPFVEGPNER